jgi:tRNA-Thr(GGU) m(6)t(6)A37 methyltransferase TsaA
MSFTFEPIGFARTPYPEKFAIPRQPGLVTSDHSYLSLTGDFNREEIVRGLEGFSHLWLSFVFHQAIKEQWKPMVRPPRLGGNKKVGVFASRSPFRPNPIGLSVVKLNSIEFSQKECRIYISGADLLDNTPILDIKPYLPYVDSIESAIGGFAKSKPTENSKVCFSAAAQDFIAKNAHSYPELEQLIEQVLAQSPEPAYQKDSDRVYGISLYDLNIRWRYSQPDDSPINDDHKHSEENLEASSPSKTIEVAQISVR